MNDSSHPATHDVTIVLGRDLDAQERAAALGVAHALRTAGLEVHEDHGHGAPRLWLVAASLQEFAATRARAANGRPTIALPIVRTADELRAWPDALRDASVVWCSSDATATAWSADGLPTCRIGPVGALGRPSHQSRRARELREEDCVFVALLDSRTSKHSARLLRDAWHGRFLDLSTRFARASLLVSTDDRADQEDWLRFCDRPDLCVTTVELRDRDPWRLAALGDVADCLITFGENNADGFAPSWAAAMMLLRDKPVITVGACGLEALAERPSPHLHAVSDTADALRAAIAAVADTHPMPLGAASDGARAMSATSSARANAVRCVESLRAAGLWNELASANKS